MPDTGMAAFARWRELVPPPDPSDRLGPSTVDWTAVEDDLGLRLPTDYKAYIDEYGVGWINKLFVVKHPTTHARPLNLGHSAREADCPEFYEGVETAPPHRLGVGPGRLFNCATTDTQDYIFWYVDGDDPDRWPIVFCDEEGWEWREYDLSLVGFLLAACTRQIALRDWLNSGHLSRPLTFTPNPWRHPIDV